MIIKTAYLDETKVAIVKMYYPNKRVALQLISDMGEPLMVATANVPTEPLAPNEVIIKNYSENAGILEALIENNVISPPIRTIQSNFVTLEVCHLRPTTDWKD